MRKCGVVGWEGVSCEFGGGDVLVERVLLPHIENYRDDLLSGPGFWGSHGSVSLSQMSHGPASR